MHSTNDLNDGYLGSGKILKASIKKYGKENHTLDYLEFFPDRESLAKKEAEIVTIQFIQLNFPLCMNIKHGGEGGKNPWTESERIKMLGIFSSTEYKEKISIRSKETWANPESRKKRVDAIKAALSNDDVKEKRSKSMKDLHASLSVNDRLSWNDSIRKAYENPEVIKKLSEKMKVLMSNTKIKEKQRTTSKEIANRPEVKERRSKQMKEFWNNPENRKRMLDSKPKELTEEERKKRSNSATKNNSRPEYRQKMSEALKKSWEIRKKK